MAPVSSTQRLVPIRPSPLKSGVAQDTIVINTVSCSTITMKTGAKRKLADNLGNHEVKCKRLNTGSAGNKSSGPSTMGRRNARERNRVKQVNNSFLTLRQHVPGASKSKKISKVETLKQATDYIRSLQRLLDEHDAMLVQNESPTPLPFNSQISNVSCSNVQAQYIQRSPVLTKTMLQHPKQENCSSVPSSTQSTTIYPDYYYSENISPISPTGYPMNLQTVQRENLLIPEQTTFKAEVNFLPSESYNNQEQQQNIIVSYPNTPTPITPVSQVTFSLTQQSPPYEIATTAYPTTITYSPNSMATQSPHSSISPTGSTYQHSPISSPSAASVAPTSSQFSPSYPRPFSDECGKPSLIDTRNFIIPAEELPYCLPPGITTLQIEQATATTKADLDLLDAISLWQDS